MKNKYKIFTIFLFFILFAIPSKGTSILDVKKNDFSIGDENAPVTIIEYSSLSCSHCADFHNKTLDDIKNEYVDNGKVRFVFRDFPFNYPALLGSMVLKCTPNIDRYEIMNALFKYQKKWVNRENNKTTKELFKLMQSTGMTKKEFNNCISNTSVENEILEGLIEAQEQFSIKSTPSFIINGNLLEGNKSSKEFRQIIDKILSQ